MKILIISNEFSTEGGGLAYGCIQFRQLLEKIGHSVTILSSDIDSSMVIKGGYNKRLGLDLAHELKLKQDSILISDHQLIIAFGGGYNAYYSALLASKCRIKLWIMFRGSDANLAKWNSDMCYYTNYSVNVAAKVICLSRELADNVDLLTLRKVKSLVIPNHSTRIENIVQAFPRKRLIVGCGASHMNEKKGLSNLLELVATYNQKYSEGMQLEIVGEIDNDILLQYEKKSNKLGIKSLIKFIGSKSRAEFRAIQKNWNLYIQASICEGMGNSVTDSMALGIPVMISDTGFIAEYAASKFPQIVFSSLSPDKMAEEIHEMISDQSSFTKYQEFYESFFDEISYDRVKKRWQNIFSNDIESIEVPDLSSIISVSLHDISGEKHDTITTPIEVFRKFNYDIFQSGYRLCSMKEYMTLPLSKRKKHIVCTFDDGYTGLLYNAMPIMNEYGFTATVFVCTEYIGKSNDWNFKDKTKRTHLSFNELMTLQHNGWEIGSHGVTHQSLLKLNDKEIDIELIESKKILENVFGPIMSYAYPYGDYSEYIMNQVKKYYDYAFLLTQGGVFLAVDSLRIHRYYISEIYHIINNI